MTADLAAWLLAPDGPIAEDEADAQQWAKDIDRHWREKRTGGACGCQACIALAWFDPEDQDETPAATLLVAPDRLLAECAAKRQIVQSYLAAGTVVDVSRNTLLRGAAAINRRAYGTAVQALAQPYAGRSGWRDEWAIRDTPTPPR